ncbi:MAG: cytochrome C oxidase subunit IV family protein [Rhodothermales bacterium]|nr:cytochrome C oxidase subunit IV family protein [Rhodothermales bacterium]
MAQTHTVEEVRKHVRVYLMVFGALAVLTIVTVAVGYLHLPVVPALIAGLLIAAIKAGLVAAYFMHLISERKVIYGVLIMTGMFFLFMVALFVSAYADQEGALFVA